MYGGQDDDGSSDERRRKVYEKIRQKFGDIPFHYPKVRDDRLTNFIDC